MISDVQLIVNHGIKPVVSSQVMLTLRARGAWEMRLATGAAPNGDWLPYDCEFNYMLPPSGGDYTIYAQVRDADVAASADVNTSVHLVRSTMGMPLATSVDNSVFYAVQETLKAEGFVDATGALTVGVYPKQIESYVPVAADEQSYGGELTSELSVPLPAITVLNMDDNPSPGGLGGAHWERRFYDISIYATSDAQSREIASILGEHLRHGITIYDYNFGFPGNSGFPLPLQVVGTFSVENLRDSRVLLPSYSLIDQYRRRLTFDVINMR